MVICLSRRRIVDLSLPIFHGMPIWSSEPKTGIVDYFKMGRCTDVEEMMNMKLLVICGHAGTHMDVPYHLVADGKDLDAISLDRCVGEATVIDFTHKGAGDDITVQDLKEHEDEIREGSRIILKTGWCKRWGTTDYFDRELIPKLTPEALRWLAHRKIWLLGVDTPSVNPYLDRHKRIFEGEDPPVVVELLTNTDQLKKRKVFFIALPLKIAGGDGSPVRAVAIEEE